MLIYTYTLQNAAFSVLQTIAYKTWPYKWRVIFNVSPRSLESDQDRPQFVFIFHLIGLYIIFS